MKKEDWDRLRLLLLVCIPWTGLDLLSKNWATDHLLHQGRLSFWSDRFRLEYATNVGSWGGFLGQLPEGLRRLALVYGVGLLLLALGVYIVRKTQTRLETIGLSLALAGGLGNLFDRAVLGYVVDFLNVGFGGLRTNIFNLADMLVLTGIGLFLLVQFRTESKAKLPENPKTSSV